MNRLMGFVVGIGFWLIAAGVSAQPCMDSTLGLRGGCDYADPDCPSGSHANYHTYEATVAYLYDLSANFDTDGHMSFVQLGRSAEHEVFNVPGTHSLDNMFAVRVAEHADAPDIEHPPILLVAAIHPNEWIASELALGYVDYLVKGADAGDPVVLALLQEAEFWVLVDGNPAGRVWDDIPVAGGQDGNPDDKANGQRKNLQWESGFDAQTYSDAASFSGYCDFASTGEVTSLGVSVWDNWGVNVARNFSVEWPFLDPVRYPRSAMLENISASSTTDYAGAGERAPELHACNPLVADSCSSLFSDHTECVRRGGTAVSPVYGCFLVDPNEAGTYNKESLASCENYVATNDVTDELGIEHVCLSTLIDPGGAGVADDDYDYLLWECGNSGDVQNSIIAYQDLAPDFDLLSWCENGTLSSCREDPVVNYCDDGIVDGTDFHPDSVHASGQRYCNGTMCAVSATHTPCHGDYRGQRPFETIESRLIRRLADNIPFSFVIDMHSSRNDLTAGSKNMGNGGDDANDEYIRIRDDLMAHMITYYNYAAETQSWQSYSSDPFPDMLMLRQHGDGVYDLNQGSGQLPPWMSSAPAPTANDPAATDWNFDNGAYRGITAFTWELGVPDEPDYDEIVVAAGEEDLFDLLIRCDQSTSAQYSTGGSAPRSSFILDNQLEGMKAMLAYLASQAETPAIPPPSGGIALPKRDLSLGGLRIHDGHGRGVQQIETGPDEIDDDTTAVTVIPAGIWAVEVDAVAGWNQTSPTVLTGDVTIEQLEYQPFSFFSWIKVDESVTSVSVNGGDRSPVVRRFRFKPGETYRIQAEVTGADACVGGANCHAANDFLVAKVKVLGCESDEPEIPNGLGSDLFCRTGLPFRNLGFECDLDRDKCRECWVEPGDQQDCEDGEFCFEGICDDSEVCWSGELVDELEGASGAESSPTITSDDPPYVRTLRLENPLGTPIQDIDSFKTVSDFPSGPGYIPPSMYWLKLVVRNLCEDDFLLGMGGVEWDWGMMEELEVRVQVTLSGAMIPGLEEDAYYENLTVSGDDGWVQIERLDGLELEITSSAAASLNSGGKLRVQVRNLESTLESIPYSVDLTLDNNGAYIGLLFPKTKVMPWDEIVWPMADVTVDLGPDEMRSFVPTDDAILNGYSLFFSPTAGYGNALGVTDFILTNRDGNVPTDPQGVPLAQTGYRDGGLAIPLGMLEPQLGPYEARLATDAERIEGRVFLCGPNVTDCSTLLPRTQACGLACTGDGALCCADDDQSLYCANARGSDVNNCGGCGYTCDWNEKCLKGVCVKGAATSCWNTTCPEGMECVSKSWPLLKNPQCRATQVDNGWCGWFGDVCTEDESCTFGLCAPKLGGECGLACGDGEACCWSWGEETCFDVQNDPLNCGGCGNVCPWGTLCANGLCAEWYEVLDVCLGDSVNCGGDGIDCTDILNDADNCGGCGIPCPDNGWCQDGVCVVETQEVHYDD